jgi:hypothetical protein
MKVTARTPAENGGRDRIVSLRRGEILVVLTGQELLPQERLFYVPMACQGGRSVLLDCVLGSGYL